MARFWSRGVAAAAAALVCTASYAGYTNPFSGYKPGQGEGTSLSSVDLASLTGAVDSNEASFRAGFSTAGTTIIDFESAGSFDTLFNVTAGLTATMVGGHLADCDSSSLGACNGRYSVVPADGDGVPISSQYWENEPVGGASSFHIEFNKAVSAVSFFMVDVGDFGGSVSIELYNDLNGPVLKTYNVLTEFLNGGGNRQGSAGFVTIRSDASSDDFKFVKFVITGGACTTPSTTDPECGADVFALDRISADLRTDVSSGGPTSSSGTTSTGSSGGGGGTVPEPLSLLLALGALGGAAVARRRRA